MSTKTVSADSLQQAGSAFCRWWVFATMPDGNRAYENVRTKALAKKCATEARRKGGKDIDIIWGGKTQSEKLAHEAGGKNL